MCPGMTALQWLLTQPAAGTRDKVDIDASLAEERAWCSLFSMPAR